MHPHKIAHLGEVVCMCVRAFDASLACVGIRKQSVVCCLLVLAEAEIKSISEWLNLYSLVLRLCHRICSICDHVVELHAILTTIKRVQWSPLRSHIREYESYYDDVTRMGCSVSGPSLVLTRIRFVANCVACVGAYVWNLLPLSHFLSPSSLFFSPPPP